MLNKKVKANSHESYGTYTLISFILPIVGLIVGIVYLTKDKVLEKKLGEHLVAISILFMIFQSILVGVFWGDIFGTSTTYSPVTPIVTTPIIQSQWNPENYYDKIQTGQTKAQVEKITGKKSESCITSETSGVGTLESCEYGDVINDKGSISIIYLNGKVQEKIKTIL